MSEAAAAPPTTTLTPPPAVEGGASLLTGDPTSGSNPPASGSPPPASAPPQSDAGAAAWREALTGDLKNDNTLKNFKDVEQLAASYVSLRKQFSAEKIALPGKEANEQEWRAVFTKLGLPEDVAKYELAAAKGSQITPEAIDSFKKAAHEAGILPKQAQKMLDWIDSGSKARMTEMAQARKTAIENGMTELKTEWGEAWNRNLRNATRAVSEAEKAAPGLKAFLNETGLGDHPLLAKVFAKWGEAFQEGDIPGKGNVGFGRSPADAQKEWNRIAADKAHPYWNHRDARHKDAVDEVQGLFRQMNPDSPGPSAA